MSPRRGHERGGHVLRPCVVCGHECKHSTGVQVVGQIPGGRSRLLCGNRHCRKIWQQSGDAIAARWPENRR